MHEERDDPAVTAYALGDLDDDERSAVESRVGASEEARREVEEVRAAAGRLRRAFASAPRHELTANQRATIEAEAARVAMAEGRPGRRRRHAWRWAAGLTAVAIAVAAVTVPTFHRKVSDNFMGYISDTDTTAAPGGRPAHPAFMSQEAAEQLRAHGYVSGTAGDTAPEKDLRASSAPARTDEYDHVRDNPFVLVSQDPRSTFSVDVDTASYTIVRRFLNGGALPPRDAVRIEELINYFPYGNAPPDGDEPFAVHMDTADCPWKRGHRLVRIAIKGREVPRGQRPPSNLVFLLDVSGSMDQPDKLPLVKAALRLLVDELGPRDRVAIVVYAGSEGLALPATSAADRTAILDAIESLSAGGGTHGSAGLRLAYETAAANFIKGGVNRVILATDGDFNVGVTSRGELVRLIEEKAKGGVTLTTLGFGMGNLKDGTLEQLAAHGNGHYAYIDGLFEAHKVLVEQIGATLVTIAKDVKLQVEFNPSRVKAFRLIGYENRVLAHQDFNDDGRDAGDIGAGHTVTALYEIVPPGADLQVPGVDPLKYQEAPRPREETGADELLTLKLRYKQPDADRSSLIEVALADRNQPFAAASPDFRFAAAVAAFGMSLRDSPYKGEANLARVLEWAKPSLGDDPGSLRTEFVTLVEKARVLSRDR